MHAVSKTPPTIDDVRAAAARIKGEVERTPTRHSTTLSQIAGCDIWLKFENLQFTSSFKERGALNKLLSLTPEQRKRGIAAMSAGNHAQGVAYHAGRLGIPTTIVMPEFTPFIKVKHTKDFGARVVLEGATLTESFGRANQIAQSEGLAFVHPYDDPVIIAGTGTIALEMLADAPDIDTLVVPIGGGGLISGIAIAAKALKPSIEITWISNGPVLPSSSRSCLTRAMRRSSSSGSPPPCIQPSSRAARRSATSAWPPIRTGIGWVGAGVIFVLGMS